jgi:cysteinyl-tRNA synthetase
MSMRYLGESFDVHGGGLDLVFPHHENEIAQSEAATGKPFATTWIHNGFVEVDKQKMSKSLGNFFTVRELFERVEPEAIRYMMLTRHYRAPINLDWNLDDEGNITGFPQFEDAEQRVEYLYATRRRLASISQSRIVDRADELPAEIARFREGLAAALDDDLNTPVALAKTAELARAVNELCDRATGKKGKVARRVVDAAAKAFDTLGRVLGLAEQDPTEVLSRIRDRRAKARGIDPAYVEGKIEERTQARQNKDFAAADAVRDELAAMGVELHDGPGGTDWVMQARERPPSA